jgi:hypothetical protein
MLLFLLALQDLFGQLIFYFVSVIQYIVTVIILLFQNICSNINTWDQALSMGDNRKQNNKNYDKEYTDLKLI